MSDEMLQIHIWEWIQDRYRENRRLMKTIQDENSGDFKTDFGAGYFDGKNTLLFQMMKRFCAERQINGLLKENDE
jgi:hypothetical protein